MASLKLRMSARAAGFAKNSSCGEAVHLRSHLEDASGPPSTVLMPAVS